MLGDQGSLLRGRLTKLSVLYESQWHNHDDEVILFLRTSVRWSCSWPTIYTINYVFPLYLGKKIKHWRGPLWACSTKWSQGYGMSCPTLPCQGCQALPTSPKQRFCCLPFLYECLKEILATHEYSMDTYRHLNLFVKIFGVTCVCHFWTCFEYVWDFCWLSLGVFVVTWGSSAGNQRSSSKGCWMIFWTCFWHFSVDPGFTWESSRTIFK